jgi:hypothetical protein
MSCAGHTKSFISDISLSTSSINWMMKSTCNATLAPFQHTRIALEGATYKLVLQHLFGVEVGNQERYVITLGDT